jgi:glycosyltransferase involved in cell wall biosynthesis
MRLAYCSPLPPQLSGIADYSAELVPELSRHFESIDLFTPAEAPNRLDQYDVYPLAELPDRGPYGAVLYHIGNDVRFHGDIYQMALQLPGIVVLHEYMLQHLMLGLVKDHGLAQQYVQTMRYCYGAEAARLAAWFLDNLNPFDCWSLPMFESVVDASRGVIVHNQVCRKRILASRPSARIAVVPHHLCLDALPAAEQSAEELRRTLELPPTGLLVATYGFLTPAKRPHVLLEAFSRLHRHHPDSRLLLVGDATPFTALQRYLASELGDGVISTGRVGLDRFLQYMQVADVAVNLRHPTGGETSGSVIRLLGLGTPVIVSRNGWFAEIPDHCCIKIGLDGQEEDNLTAAMLVLAEQPELRQRLGDNARRYIATHHTLAGSGCGYAEAIQSFAGQEPLSSDAVAVPEPADPLIAGLVTDVGAALHDLGVDESDDDLIADIAGVMQGLVYG